MLFAFATTAGIFPKSITFLPAHRRCHFATRCALNSNWHAKDAAKKCSQTWRNEANAQTDRERVSEGQQNGIKVKIVGQKKISSVCVQVKTIIQTFLAAGWVREREAEMKTKKFAHIIYFYFYEFPPGGIDNTLALSQLPADWGSLGRAVFLIREMGWRHVRMRVGQTTLTLLIIISPPLSPVTLSDMQSIKSD